MGATMIHIKIEYDAYNRIFKLRDREFGSVLQDGVVYNLVLPIIAEEPEEECFTGEASLVVSNPVSAVL